MSTTTPPPEGHDPDDLLSPEEGDVRRHYASLSQPGPGPELDAQVRRMAGQALDEGAVYGRSRTDGHARGRQRGSGRRGPRAWWLAAVGSAAVAVLAVGLVRHQHVGPPTAQPPARVEHAPEDKAARQVVNPTASHALPATRVPALELRAEPSPLKQVTPMAPPVQPKPVRPVLATAPPAPSSPAARLSFRAVPSSTMHASSKSARAFRAPVPKRQYSDAETKALQHIRDLFAHDKTEQALDLLKTFHKAHPHLQLPADLRAQLPEK